MLRLVETVTSPLHVAKVYRDTGWNEYRVRLFAIGTHRALPDMHVSGADYHTEHKADAIGTAREMVASADQVEG